MVERCHSDWVRAAIAVLREEAAATPPTPLRIGIERIGAHVGEPGRIHIKMDADGGDIVIVAGDGDRTYRRTFYDDAWTAAKGLDPGPHRRVLEEFAATGRWSPGT